MERIESLRKLALDKDYNANEFYYRFYKNYKGGTLPVVFSEYADALYKAFSELSVNIADGELVVGRVADNMKDEEKAEWNNTLKQSAEELFWANRFGKDSHMAIDYGDLLKLGIRGIILKIDEYEKSSTPDKLEFYRSAKICLEAVIKHSEMYADEAVRLAESEKNEKRREELLKIAEICRKVPAEPAESFYEAVQSVHFITYCVTLNPIRNYAQQYQLGNPDRYLYPYYKKDIEEGKIDRDFARLIVDCLGIQINMRVPKGFSSGYMVGGRDENGVLVENELSFMLLNVIEDIRLVAPAVGLCYNEGMSEELLRLGCRLLLNGRSHPAIFNDEVITRGLLSYGVSPKEAHNYIHSTCVEITPTGASNVWVTSPFTNVPAILLDTMNRDFDTFDEFFRAFLDAFSEKIKSDFLTMHDWRIRRRDFSVNPLLSVFVNDCLERGVDIEKGGARYNWIMPSFVGLANVVDSLYAVKRVVFEEKRVTISEFKAILDSNFENDPSLQHYIAQEIPKYGNDNDDVDKYFSVISRFICDECDKYESIFSESRVIPSAFCFIRHETFGRETGATPDGRVAGFPLGDGSGPCQGREMMGPTASILSATKWDHHRFIGGIAVNMKFSKSSLGPDSLDTLVSLVKVYMLRGGFEVQINVVDKETLEKARKTPEAYRDLIVRIGGYSDYFTRLSSEMQSELILRTEHCI